MKLISWSLSDVGRKRDHNEDSHLIDEKLRLYAVADGMGGHQGGDRASRMAIDVLRREVSLVEDFDDAAKMILERDPLAAMYPCNLAVSLLAREGGPAKGSSSTVASAEKEAPALMRWTPGLPGYGSGGLARTSAPFSDDDTDEDLAQIPTDPGLVVQPPPAATILRSAARIAGRAIYDTAQGDPRLQGMGTTLTALMFHKDRAHLVHVGDSRGFLFRDGEIFQVTEDHSWIAEQVKAGVLSLEEARESKFRHIITRSVGFEREVDVDVLGVPVLPGDCFLLCSDGMSNHVETEEIGRILAATYYCRVPRLLVDLANDRGGDDNITVVLVYAANDAAA
jgi:serine/threonine protein phosphatase PrpC